MINPALKIHCQNNLFSIQEFLKRLHSSHFFDEREGDLVALPRGLVLALLLLLLLLFNVRNCEVELDVSTHS
jgi:uncharacterized integral membrane protein